MANGNGGNGAAQQPGAGVIACETRRRLQPVPFTANAVRVLDLPRDTVLKRMSVRLSGSFSVTYASGSPVFNARGMMALLCPRFDIVIDGQRVVKSIDFYMQQLLNTIYTGDRPRRAYATSASAFTTLLAATEWESGTVAYPATTQFVLINEVATVYFENVFAPDFGKEATLLNIKQVSSAEARFNFGAIDSLQRDETSPVAVTYGSIDLNYQVTLIESRDIPADAQFLDFKETIARETFTGEVRARLVDLPRGNALAGVAMLARDGDANRSLRDRAFRDLQLLINGQQIIQSTTFDELQDDNEGYNGCRDVRASSRHTLEGFSFMRLIKNGDIRTALNTAIQAGVDQVQLSVTSAPSSGVDAATYTNPVELTVWRQEIVAVPARV